MAEEAPEAHEIPVRWCFPEGMTGRYATNIVVQNIGREFIISFFEAFPPLIFGPKEEVRRRLADIGHIDAQCVARIIVSAERMPAFVEALQQNLEHFRARQEE